MRNHRFATFFGAGAALAACLGLASFLIVSHGNGRVEAAQIFQSFRNAAKKAFNVRIENVVDDGFRADGNILVILCDEGEEPAPAADAIIAGDLEEKGAFVEMRIVGEEDGPAPGLEVDLAVAVSPQRQWLYVKTGELPPELLADQPMAAWFAGLARNGMFVELGDMLTNERLNPAVAMAISKPDVGPDGIEGPSATFKLQVGFQADGRSAPDDASTVDADAVLDESTARWTFNFRAGASDSPADDSQPDNDDVQDAATSRQQAQQQALQAGADAMGIEYDQMLKLAEILNALFTGQMTQEQLDTVITWIENNAGVVDVAQRADGMYVLTASQFDLSALPVNEEVRQELAQNSIEIGYTPETGVEYAAVLNVGAAGGRMVFEFVDRDIDDEVFDPARYLEDPAVRRIDLTKMFGGLFGSASKNTDSNSSNTDAADSTDDDTVTADTDTVGTNADGGI